MGMDTTKESVAGFDSSKIWLTIAVCLQIVSRIPFVFLGYGDDDDAWRVARVAEEFFRTGHYSASRLPGYPLFETINALLIPLGKWYLSNTATLAVSVITLVVFYKIVRYLKLKYWNYLLILFVFFPLFWVNSANTMDYIWAVLFILSSFYFLLRERLIAAAVLLGISAGFRLSSCVFIVPYSAYLLASGNKKRLPAFVLLSAAFGLAAFSLPIITYGSGVFSLYRPKIYELSHIPYYALYTIGVIPCLILLIGLVRYGGRIWKSIICGDEVSIACVTAIVTVTALFCVVPQDKAYLMPLFPFLFILLGRFFSEKFLLAFIVFALLYGFVRIEVKDEASLDVVRFKPHISDGMVVGSYRHLGAQFRLRDRLAPYLVDKFGRNSKALFISGYIVGLPQLVGNEDFEKISIPGIKADLYSVRGSGILILSGTITEESYDYFKDNGYRMLFLQGSIRYARNAFGFDIDASKEEIISAGEILKAKEED
jgi:hypothetical protein